MVARILKMMLAFMACMFVPIGVVVGALLASGLLRDRGPGLAVLLVALPLQIAFAVLMYFRLADSFLSFPPQAGAPRLSETELADRLVRAFGARRDDGAAFDVYSEPHVVVISRRYTREDVRLTSGGRLELKEVFALTLNEGDGSVRLLMKQRRADWTASARGAGLSFAFQTGIYAAYERAQAPSFRRGPNGEVEVDARTFRYSTNEFWEIIEATVTGAGWTLRPGLLARPGHAWVAAGAALVVGLAVSGGVAAIGSAPAAHPSASQGSGDRPPSAPPPAGSATLSHDTIAGGARGMTTLQLHDFLEAQRALPLARLAPIQKRILRIYVREYETRSGADPALVDSFEALPEESTAGEGR